MVRIWRVPCGSCVGTFVHYQGVTSVDKTVAIVTVIVLLCLAPVSASDWPCFRGPGSAAISDEGNLPTTWSETENLKWKLTLPGPGSSSPIVSGDRLFVTCYSGYGVDRRDPGQPEDLKRHLLCIRAADGKVIWQRSVGAVLPEDPYRGNIGEHGYASSTPATDGKHVYAFFGKSGLWAYDIEGNQLWQKGLGTESSNRRWGSAASPILYKNLLIVNASEESLTLYALDKTSGQEVWKVEADKLELSYSTPVIVTLPDGREELVIAVPSEIWAFEPETGKLNWYAQTTLGGNVCPTPVAAEGLLYVFGGFPSTEAVAIRCGGEDDVTDTHIAWTSRDASYVPSPLVHEGHLYWVSDTGQAYCAEARTGKVLYSERLPARGPGKPFYASVVLADGKLYAVSRTSGTFVLAAKPQFEQLAHNSFASDASDFSASPAISDGRIFLRPNQSLYCVARD